MLSYDGGTYALWDYFKIKSGVRMNYQGEQIRLLPHYAKIAELETAEWEQVYLPNFSLKEKTVLDIGIGCGESGIFYLSHGASRVIGIENNEDAAKFAIRNLRKFNTEIIHEPFNLQHLKIPHDFVKIDIEGGESALENYEGILNACVIEIHDWLPEKTRNSIVQKFNLKLVLKRHLAGIYQNWS